MFRPDPSLTTKLERDEAVVGAIAKVPSPALIEVYGEVGLDFAFIDHEHSDASPYDSLHLEHVVRAASLADIEPLVRLPSGDPPLVRKVLDAGVRSILIPRVKTADEVRAAVEATRFEYEGSPGERGYVSGCLANRWGRDLEGYLKREDQHALVGVLVETAEAIDNLEDILAVPEVGFVMIGRRDLTVSLGHGANADHSAVQEAVDAVRDACVSAGVPVGRAVGDPAAAKRAREAGYQFFVIGYEFDAVRDSFGAWLEDFES